MPTTGSFSNLRIFGVMLILDLQPFIFEWQLACRFGRSL